MKRIYILSLLFMSFFAFTAKAQCGDNTLQQALQKMGDVQYLKDFAVDIKSDNASSDLNKVKFNVILNSNSQYKFNTVNGSSNAEKVVFELYDGDKLLASNIDGTKVYESFEFICRKSKVYSLVFHTKGGQEACARTVMSLVKQFSAGDL